MKKEKGKKKGKRKKERKREKRKEKGKREKRDKRKKKEKNLLKLHIPMSTNSLFLLLKGGTNARQNQYASKANANPP